MEGAPGLAKTRAIKELADRVEGDFQRIQFTPDLLPTTSRVAKFVLKMALSVSSKVQSFTIILADEINRAPLKFNQHFLRPCQKDKSASASDFRLTRTVPRLPPRTIEQEGTYALPELSSIGSWHLLVDYPDSESELKILNLVRNERQTEHIWIKQTVKAVW